MKCFLLKNMAANVVIALMAVTTINAFSLTSLNRYASTRSQARLSQLTSTSTVSVLEPEQSAPAVENFGSFLPEEPLQLSDIRKSIPPEAFIKSPIKSLYYMFFDFAMWGGTFAAFYALVNSSIWAAMPLPLQAMAQGLYSAVAGFFMWCIFVVGHDCGHTTFSNNKLLNDIIGHVTHGSLLVPFYSWQLSHRRHHMFHNHEYKDYSYMWYTDERIKKEDNPVTRNFALNKYFTAIFPFFGWPLYLLGINDGSHFVPIKGGPGNGRLWTEGSTRGEGVKCLISAAVVGLYASAFWLLSGKSLMTLATFYLGPYISFGWWLVTVTYLQHHGPNTVVYDDKDWKFAESAFETVDRKFGFGIDALHHHITDGHVAHHLFFTQIPHYNLPLATAGIRNYLAKKGLSHMYRLDKTFDFPKRIHEYLFSTGFRAKRYQPQPKKIDNDDAAAVL